MKKIAFLIVLAASLSLLFLSARAGNEARELYLAAEKEYPIAYAGIPREEDLKSRSEEEVKAICIDIMDRQGPAIRAAEKIHQLFVLNPEGIWEYPDEYGGSYIEEFILYVLLTDTSPGTLEKYERALGSLLGAVRFKQVKYSENELRAHLVEIVREAGRRKVHLLQYATQPELNQIVVHVRESEAEDFRNILREFGKESYVRVVEDREDSAPLAGG